MGSVYPGSPPGSATDVFTVPTAPEGTPLSEAGTGTRNLTESVQDLGLAVEGLEAGAAYRTHDHSGDATSTVKGSKLAQANTHQSPDTDTAPTSLHHTLGTGANQAAPGNHNHNYYNLLGIPLYICTTLTRPPSPTLGQVIIETDTNTWRMWSKFPQQANPIWQLLPVGATPVLRAESRTTTQVIHQSERHVCFWTDVIEDWFGWLDHDDRRFLKLETSNTDIVATESGHYDIHASICWDPNNTWNDHGMIGVEVNGVDIARRNWEFLRGFSNTPGFSQTNEISMHWYLNAGDVVRVVAQHNATRDCWLWWDNDHAGHNAQVSYVELVFVKP